MVSLNEETTIASPPDAIWPLLRDPAVVARCIPGAELSVDPADGMWRGSIRVKFGPTVAVFKGEASLAFDDAGRRLTIDGRGIDGRGASRALASSVVTLEGHDTTTMKVEGEFNVTGPLESFVNAGGVHVARAMLADFSANIANAVALRGGAQNSPAEAPAQTPAAPEPTPPPSAVPMGGASQPPTREALAASPRSPELRVGAVLWKALIGWVKGLAGKGQ